MPPRFFGGLSPRDFLRRHWQRRPLFVPQALPRFAGVVDAAELAQLAERDDVESRIVVRHGRRWRTTHGPFAKVRPRPRDWTLLVSGVNLHLPAADALLRRFGFIPQARLDDVMVSYATPGGGVGPHVDSYDVFLLQGPGRRRWRVGSREYVVQAGDLLYLPPGIEHDGVALEPCFTYSIGFRAPSGAELGAAFLDWLHERGFPRAPRYADADLEPVARSARIPERMVDYADRVLSRIRWNRRHVADFLGRYLSTPKPHVVFRRSATRGPLARLDAKTQLLYSGSRFFMNGESFTVGKRAFAALRTLADRREIEAARLAPLGERVAEWRRAGYLHFTRRETR